MPGRSTARGRRGAPPGLVPRGRGPRHARRPIRGAFEPRRWPSSGSRTATRRPCAIRCADRKLHRRHGRADARGRLRRSVDRQAGALMVGALATGSIGGAARGGDLDWSDAVGRIYRDEPPEAEAAATFARSAAALQRGPRRVRRPRGDRRAASLERFRPSPAARPDPRRRPDRPHRR